MGEYLSFNKGGQWELHKATSPTISNPEPPKDAERPGNKPYKVFRGNALNGDLHEDFGGKGSLHDFNGGKRPKAGRINWKNAAKPAKHFDSAFEERNPGEAAID